MSKRILVCSDAVFPLSNTGFAIAVRPLIDGLLESGYRVGHIARGSTLDENKARAEFGEYIRTGALEILGCPSNDINGYGYLGYVLTRAQAEDPFSAIIYLADAHSVNGFRQNIEARLLPTIFYGPTEGGPLCKPGSTALAELIASGGIVSTYTSFSAQVIREGVSKLFADSVPEFEIPIFPHGVDHANFRVLDNRDEIRAKLGWNTRVVLMNVARNAGRKMWLRLFKAVQILAKKHPEILLYAHTVMFENFALEGHDLGEKVAEYGIKNNVMFPKGMWDPNHGMNFETMIERYNAADAFVCPSGAEGWGLPLAEAAACGLPCFATAYSGMWEWSKDFAIPLMPRSWFDHSSGSVLALVDPEEVADVIEENLILNREWTRDCVQRGLEVTAGLKWQTLKTGIVGLVKQLVGE